VAYYLDENIAVDIVEWLREKGIRVTTVYEQGQAGVDADTYLLKKALELTCIFVTNDQGVEGVHERIMGLEGLRHAGLVIVKSRTYRDYPAQLASRLYRMAGKYEGWADWLHGQLIDL
jgi:hypothetical protein